MPSASAATARTRAARSPSISASATPAARGRSPSTDRLQGVRIGDLTYFTGDAAFWHEYVGSAAAAKLLTSKWLKVPSNSSGYKSLAAIADMDRELRTHLSPEGTVSKGTSEATTVSP